MASTTEMITLEQLASVDAKLLFQALEMRLASAGVLKKRGGKKAAKASSGDDAGSHVSREQPAAVKEWQALMSEINVVYKKLLADAGEKPVAGSHFKISALVKKNLLAAEREPSSFTEDDVRAAWDFLKANPDHKSATQERRASKSSEGESASSDDAAPKKVVIIKKSTAASSASTAVSKPSAEEKKAAKEAEKAAKKAAQEAEKAAKKAEKEAAKAAEKAAKAAEKKSAKKPAAKPEAKVEDASDAAEEDTELVEIELEGVSYYWDTASGSVFENHDGHPGERIGSWDGASSDITRDD